jgi:hypothetical protein
VFYIGTNSDGELTAIRRHILGSFENLPIAAEYVHRDAFDIAERNGKDTFLLIRAIGTTNLFISSQRSPGLTTSRDVSPFCRRTSATALSGRSAGCSRLTCREG